MRAREIDSIIVHHTASPEEALTWEQIRDYHVHERGYLDIGYHYGVVKDDRGWSIKKGRDPDIVGAHCRGHNRSSLGVVVEGNYSLTDLDDEPFQLVVALLVDLCEEFAVAPARIYGHRELAATECPGNFFPLAKLKAHVKSRANSRT